MPNKKSGEKELRKGNRRAERNLEVKIALKKSIKDTKKAIEAKDPKAEEMVLKTLKVIDKACQKGIIKKNTRDRKKSRLHTSLNVSKKTLKK